MASWFLSSPVDELVDKATSENLPAGTEDLALNLEICDQIRSKQIPPKDAARALKRRISHKNPNVQLLALGLTDVCVKNGGQHFLVEVASRDFIDNLTSILKTPGVNLEVRKKILALIQTWGRLFISKRGLGYVSDTYQILKSEGYDFPPVDNVGAAIMETEAPPDWTDSDVCTRCRVAFTLTNRKHHCRACGHTYCGQCSSKNMALPELGVTQEVRVCDGCWTKRKLGQKNTPSKDPYALDSYTDLASRVPISAPLISKTAAVNNSSEDDDVMKAIELSLKEANSRPGFSAPSARQPTQLTQSSAAQGEEDDADLLAAIEASLRETNINEQASASKKHDEPTSNYTAYTYTTQPEATTTAPALTDDLTATDKESIEMFSALVDRIQIMNGDVSGNREVQALYEQITKLQAKVTARLEEAVQRQQEAMQANGKIDQAVKIYDHLLQERLNSTYQRRMNTNNYGPPDNMQQPVAPGSDYAPHAYPQMAGADSRYAPYTSGAPYNQQQYIPSFPTSTQTSYQPSLPPATTPFAPNSGYAAPSGIDYGGSAPFAPIQDPYYASAPATAPSTAPYQHQDYSSQAYAPTLSGAVNMMDSVSQSSYAPYSSQQQPYVSQHASQAPGQGYSQGQGPVSVVSPAPVVSPTAAQAPVVPVEEKPLIEF
ncbi:Vacuolar protein-sorting-associated protein 27 [Linnemannia schmuckeri]|uniref:Vacuolar protein sorting-associated protein 27 n=1 Tax=Linnemannia schmuckeri TaxID=64567 RepID=A0A9P5S0J8_9FUNG|nr:Vacuolar protein-sorting-associated protein 27 [Linnemannia schmuckeri]